MEPGAYAAIQVLIDEAAIAARLDSMANEITEYYRGKPLTVVAILNGSLLFAADLLRRVPLPLKLECLSVGSYHGEMESSGEVRFHQNRLPSLEGRHVLLLDDILDTGLTLAAVTEKLRSGANAREIRTAVFLRKENQAPARFEADWVGFAIPDEFVVGYGLDYQGEYRNLPHVAVLPNYSMSRQTGFSPS